MDLPFENDAFDVITAFETIYFWSDINEAFKQVYRVIRSNGTFLICNEVTGKKPEEGKWTDIIQEMKIYNSEQIERSLLNAGFADIRTCKEKGWLCMVCRK